MSIPLESKLLLKTNNPRAHKSLMGFTLIELMISIGIFSLVVLAAIAMMGKIFTAQAKAVAIKEVLDNARFPLELITRELRTSDHVIENQTVFCTDGTRRIGLYFISNNQNIPQERFYYSKDTDGDEKDDAVMRIAMPGTGQPIDCTLAQQLNGSDVIIDGFLPLVVGGAVAAPSTASDGQPRIVFSYHVQSRNPKLGAETSIYIQTTVTQRYLDYIPPITP